MTNKMHAAEGSEPAACSGRRAHDTLLGSVGRPERAARIETARPAAARSGGANPTGIVPGPAASHPLAGEGTSAAGMDVSSLNCARQASNPAGRLSRDEFVHVAVPMLAQGATWRDVGEALGLSWKAAKRRGEEYGLKNPRGPGRPKGSVNSPETMARIAETLRRRWLEGRR